MENPSKVDDLDFPIINPHIHPQKNSNIGTPKILYFRKSSYNVYIPIHNTHDPHGEARDRVNWSE